MAQSTQRIRLFRVLTDMIRIVDDLKAREWPRDDVQALLLDVIREIETAGDAAFAQDLTLAIDSIERAERALEAVRRTLDDGDTKAAAVLSLGSEKVSTSHQAGCPARRRRATCRCATINAAVVREAFDVATRLLDADERHELARALELRFLVARARRRGIRRAWATFHADLQLPSVTVVIQRRAHVQVCLDFEHSSRSLPAPLARELARSLAIHAYRRRMSVTATRATALVAFADGLGVARLLSSFASRAVAT